MSRWVGVGTQQPRAGFESRGRKSGTIPLGHRVPTTYRVNRWKRQLNWVTSLKHKHNYAFYRRIILDINKLSTLLYQSLNSGWTYCTYGWRSGNRTVVGRQRSFPLNKWKNTHLYKRGVQQCFHCQNNVSCFVKEYFSRRQSNLAKGRAVVCRRNVVDIFYHIRQLAARVAKLVLGCIWDPRLGKGKS